MISRTSKTTVGLSLAALLGGLLLFGVAVGDEVRPGVKERIKEKLKERIKGKDTNNGTRQSPWRNIKTAIQKLDPGRTLCVMKADYRAAGRIAISKKGSQASPVRIIGDGAVVEGFDLKGSQWVEIGGFTVIGPKKLPSGWKDMPAVVIDDPSVTIDRHEKWAAGRRDKVARKYTPYAAFNAWINDRTAGVDVSSSQDITIVGNDISLHSVGIELGEETARSTIDGNAIHHTVDAVWGSGTKNTGVSFSDSVIRNNRVSQTFREGIRLTYGARNNVVEKNVVEYSAHSHIVTYAAGGNNVVSHNTVRYGGYYTEAMRAPGGSAISIHSGGAGNRVEANSIAYHYDATLADGNGIIDYTPQRAFVANNVIIRTMGSGITVTESGNSVIVHNTIVETGYETPSRKNGVGFRTTAEVDRNNVFANNIVYAPSVGGMLFTAGNLRQQKYIDHNLFYFRGRLPLAADGLSRDKIFVDLAAFQKAGFGANSLVADPLFVNAAEGNVRLKDDSPAIGKETPRYTVETGHAGAKRASASPTIGAFER